jgi:hypothetical protein
MMEKEDILMALEYYENIIEEYENINNIMPCDIPCTIDADWTKKYEMACIVYELLEEQLNFIEKEVE